MNELIPTTAANMTALQVCQQADNLNKLGQVLAASGFFGAVTPSAATAAMINCAMEGISPIEYRAKYHTLGDGTTSVKSDYIQREFHRLGGKWNFNEWTDKVCDMTFTYDGQELRAKVTLDEFIANGVACGKDGKTLKVNWQKFPREMLKARCMATNIRALCPEALGGLYTAEEAADFDRKPTVAAPSPTKVSVSPSPVAEPPTAKPAPIVPEVVDPAPVDLGVCPVGRSKGKRFEELSTDVLEKLLAADPKKFPALTADHKNVIVAILGEREAAQ